MDLAPNRTFIVEWSGYRLTVGNGNETINFQVKLFETTNVVEVQYGSITTNNAALTTGTVEVGLKSASNVYNNVTFTNATLTGYPYTNNWNSLVNGASQSDIVGLTNAIFPSGGTTLRWTPSTCTQVTPAATASAITGNSATISWTNSATYANGYRVRWRKVDETYSATTWTTPVTLAAGSSSYTITGLAASTYYVYSIEGLCSGSSANNYSTVTTSNTTNGKGLFQTSCGTVSLPYPQGFNSTTIPSCWTQQFVTGTSAVQFVASSSNPATTPQEGADYVYWNSFSITSGNQTRLVSPAIVTTGAPSVNAKFYWNHDNSGSTGASFADEGIRLQYSLNGTTWTDVQTINRLLTGTNGWTLYDISLPPAAANVPTLYVGFLFTSRFGNNCAMDNLLVYTSTPCTTPTAQPTGLVLSSVTSTSLNGSFTAASPVPTGYIVLRSTSNVAPALVNGTNYTIGSTYTLPTNSYTIVSNGTATSFSQTGLVANTQYYYYTYSYNGSCAGAPFYLTTSPTTATALTCTAAPGSLTGSATGTTTANISFGSVTGAVSYQLQYSVAGANSWVTASPAPTVSPYVLTGLNPATTYDIRLQGPNANCGTNTTTLTAFSTSCGILNVPYSQNFDGVTAPAIPNCLAVVNTNADGSTWKTCTGTSLGNATSIAPNSGANQMGIAYNSTVAMDDWFFLPGINLTAGTSYRLSFYVRGYTGLTEQIEVKYGTAANAASMATTLLASTAIPGNVSYALKTIDFIPASTNAFYIGFHGLSASNQWYLFVDDVSLTVSPPTLSATSITGFGNVCTGATAGPNSFTVSGLVLNNTNVNIAAVTGFPMLPILRDLTLQHFLCPSQAELTAS